MSKILFVALALFFAASAAAPAAVSANISAALDDAARPPSDKAHDDLRKPGDVIAFAGLKPGDRIADFMSGNGYFTRIFSKIVGAQGRVYAYTPVEELRNCSPDETAGIFTIAKDAHYPNVRVLLGPVNDFATAETLDMVWTAQNFHDLYDRFMGPADVPAVMRAIFRALKPGGVFLVIDHAAESGSGVRDTEALHRIDPQVIIREVQAAGFTLEAQSDLLRNSSDAHKLRVFDPAIRGRTDQVVLKFRKPA